jgi:hypothetical protein
MFQTDNSCNNPVKKGFFVFQGYVSSAIMFRSRTARVFGHGQMLFRGALEALPVKSTRRPSGIILLSGVRHQSSLPLFAPHKVGVKTFGRQPQPSSRRDNIASWSVWELPGRKSHALLESTVQWEHINVGFNDVNTLYWNCKEIS